MTTETPFVPESVEEAQEVLSSSRTVPTSALTREGFVKAWNAIAYLFPELHPDGADDWPDHLMPFAAEARRRAERGDLSDDELYPSDAQWCGLCDRIAAPSVEESTRRMQFVRRPTIRVGDIVRYRTPYPDEVGTRFVITEWNIDRGYGRMLHTGLSIAPLQLLRFRDIEAVGSVDG